jgi:hypothetical protein
MSALQLRIMGAVFAGINVLTYFSPGVREILVYLDPYPALFVLFGGFVAGMIVIPFLATEKTWVGERNNWLVFLLSAMLSLQVIWLFDVFVGAFCRGPNWNFYWPWEERDDFRVVIQYRRDFSEMIWLYILDARPRFWLARESPGLVVVSMFILGVPIMVALVTRRHLHSNTRSFWRLATILVLLQFISILPFKMLFSFLLNGRYLVSLPEFTLNI